MEPDAENPREAANQEYRIPLLRNMSDEERGQTRNFLCLRNVNRDVIGLMAIALGLAGIIGFLFLVSSN